MAGVDCSGTRQCNHVVVCIACAAAMGWCMCITLRSVLVLAIAWHSVPGRMAKGRQITVAEQRVTICALSDHSQCSGPWLIGRTAVMLVPCRPDMNMARLQRSTQRLMLADFDAKVCGVAAQGHNLATVVVVVHPLELAQCREVGVCIDNDLHIVLQSTVCRSTCEASAVVR